MHATLLNTPGDARIAGVFRTRQNWIGGTENSPRGAAFIPPPETEVSSLIEDLCRFINRADLPPVVQAAIAHAQFEAIHPFADGNGRVGRCLIQVVFRRRHQGLRFVPPVSVILATNAEAYIGGLTAFRAGLLAEWSARSPPRTARRLARSGPHGPSDYASPNMVDQSREASGGFWRGTPY